MNRAEGSTELREANLTQPGIVGQSIRRREDTRLLTGSGQYVDDVTLPGMLHAAFVRSPVARAQITRIDTRQALTLPGVAAVLTGSPSELIPRMPLSVPGVARTPDKGPLSAGDVRFVGDPVALVVAESRYIAEDGCDLVEVEYECEPPVLDYQNAHEARSLRVHPEMESNVAWSAGSGNDADVEEVLSRAEYVFDKTIRQRRVTHVPMETHGIIASWSPAGQELTVWLSTQVPHACRTFISKVLDIPEHQIRIIMRDVGGGFGAKAFLSREELCVALISRRMGRAIKWIQDRRENLHASMQAREEAMHVRLAITSEGIIQAAHVEHVVDIGSYPLMSAEIIPFVSTLMFPGPYHMPAYGWNARSVFTNTCGNGPYRAPWLMESAARELALDYAARSLGIDRAEIRHRNVIHARELPLQTASGAVYENITPEETLTQALEMAGYEEFKAEQEAARAQGRYLGIGISMFIEPTAAGFGDAPSSEVATIRVEPTGRVTLLMGTASHGQSLETTMPQVVAEYLGVRVEDVILLQGDTASAPFGGGTLGSRSAVIAGGAARMSALKLREKVAMVAAYLLKVDVEALLIADGHITVKGSPGTGIEFAEVARVAYMDTGQLPEGTEAGLENTSRYTAPPGFRFSNATHVCKCEVDLETGQVELLDYVVSEDCGIMINPMVVDGQVSGAVVQGIGQVLLEHMAYDSTGTPLASTLKEYLLPTGDLIPTIRIGHIETPSVTPGGQKGVAEGGTIGAVAAVACAIADALAPLGVQVADLSLGPDAILRLIGEAQASPADQS